VFYAAPRLWVPGSMSLIGENVPVTDLSVVIPVCNGAATLAAQLDALTSQQWSGSWEIVVADNGSTDGTVELVESYRARDPRVRLVDASAIPGASYARNRGVDQARGELLAFCDADDVVESGWVAAIGDALRKHDCVGGRNLFDRLNPPWLQTAFYSAPPDRIEKFAGIFPFTATCNLGVRRSVLESVGRFDDSFAHAEDIEFCLRLWIAGFDLIYVGDAAVQYRYRPTIRSLWKQSFDYGATAPRIVRKLKQLGQPTPSTVAGLHNWVWLLRKLPTLADQAGRARWVVVAGNKCGRLVGSVRARTVFL